MTDDLRIPEILAPAGGREQFFAALHAGADAVFLGLKHFNARARAENFTVEDLLELVPLAHRYDMKVLVTVNVLIKEEERGDLVSLLAALEAAEVDAIIVQDLGVARLARACFPGLRLHASTQMAVHNLAGVRKAQALGFRRVVLAREMTAVELRKIRSKIPREEVEIEAFCHGSLCYSYSGLCFFSGAEDARSGNRGECAYTCRQPYDILGEEKNGFLFSMKDLDTSKNLDDLVRAGVDTLKIEGRKKDAQYVASTVRLYRAKLDELFGFATLRAAAPRKKNSTDPGTSLPVNLSLEEIESDLALTFQRQPTTFFLKGRYHENVIDLDNPTHQGVAIGHVTKIDGGINPKIHVKLTKSIERFDGIRILSSMQIDHQRRYENAHLEFSLRDMTLRGKRVYSAPAGTDVEITLPAEKALPKVGDSVYKTRSADLKRRIAHMAIPPEDAKLRRFRSIQVLIEAHPEGESLLLTAQALKQGTVLGVAKLLVPKIKARGPASLVADLGAAMNVMGNSGFFATTCTFVGDEDWFVPRSLLKKLREQLEDGLPRAYEAWYTSREAEAHTFLLKPHSGSPERPALARKTRERCYSVKTDRLETLHAVLAYHQENPLFPLEEVIFEPKRAFLPTQGPEELASELSQLAAAHGVALRIALPTVIRAWDEPLLARWIKALYLRGVRRFEVGNLGAFDLLSTWGLDPHELDLSGDFTLYALNSCSTRAWLEMGLSTVSVSIEDDRKNLTQHVNHLEAHEVARLTAIVFKDTPLFIAEACSLTALHQGCPTAEVCGYRTLTIKNPRGDTFHVAHETCKSVVYGQEAFALSHKQEALLALGIRHLRVDFLTRAYDATRLQEVLRSVWAMEPIPETHKANWDRSLL